MLLNMLRLEEADPSMMVKQSFLQAGQRATWHATSHTTCNVACNISVHATIRRRPQLAMVCAAGSWLVRLHVLLRGAPCAVGILQYQRLRSRPKLEAKIAELIAEKEGIVLKDERVPT